MKSRSRPHIATIFTTTVVTWGVWNAFTDHFPLNENMARPSWYIYGWPLCFTNSGRGRLNFLHFSWPAFLIDVTLSLLVIICTAIAIELLIRRLPRLSIADLLGITTGFCLIFLLLTGQLEHVWERLPGISATYPGTSPTAGQIVLTVRSSPLILYPFTLGFACVGYTIVTLPLLRANRRSTPASPESSDG